MAKAIENQRCTAVHIAKNVTLKTAKTGQGTALPVKFVGTQFFVMRKVCACPLKVLGDYYKFNRL